MGGEKSTSLEADEPNDDDLNKETGSLSRWFPVRNA